MAKELKKVAKSTKSTKATKTAKKELTAKDRKKVTGGLKSGEIKVRGARALSGGNNPLLVLDCMNKTKNGSVEIFVGNLNYDEEEED